MFDIFLEERAFPNLEMKAQPCELVFCAKAADDFEQALDRAVFFAVTTLDERMGAERE